MSTGTILTTDIKPSAPAVNLGLRAIFATYTPGGSGGNYTLDLTKNFLYGLKIGDVQRTGGQREQIELPIDTVPGNTARSLEGTIGHSDITLTIEPDGKTGLRQPPGLVVENGMYLEPHGVLFIGYLDKNDQTKLICISEDPVNIKELGGWQWQKKTPLTSNIVFTTTGDGSKFGFNVVGKTLAYTQPV